MGKRASAAGVGIDTSERFGGGKRRRRHIDGREVTALGIVVLGILAASIYFTHVEGDKCALGLISTVAMPRDIPEKVQIYKSPNVTLYLRPDGAYDLTNTATTLLRINEIDNQLILPDEECPGTQDKISYQTTEQNIFVKVERTR